MPPGAGLTPIGRAPGGMPPGEALENRQITVHSLLCTVLTDTGGPNGASG